MSLDNSERGKKSPRGSGASPHPPAPDAPDWAQNPIPLSQSDNRAGGHMTEQNQLLAVGGNQSSPGTFAFFFFFLLFFLKYSNCDFSFNLFLFIYFWLCWVFISVRGLSLVAASGGHSSSRCAGLPLSWPLFLRSTGSRRTGSVVVAHGPSCSAACGIFPDQGSNPCPLR